jgi:hypothetical protein
MRNDSTCKDKSKVIAREFKIFDHISAIRHNEDYWAIMNPQNKVTHHLSRCFSKTHYDMIMEFMGKRLIFNPLHIQHLMHDSNNINNVIGFKASNCIDFTYHGTRTKHVDCGYDNPTRIENSCTFMNDLSSAQTMVPFPHSQFFIKALNEALQTSTTSQWTV